MPILAASGIGCSAKRYAGSVYTRMALNVILQTRFGPQDRQNALFALRKIRRITLPDSHKHGKTASNSTRLSFLVLHFFLPMASTTVLTMLRQKHALHCGKPCSYLETDLPISTLRHCTKSFEQVVVNAVSEKSANCHLSNRRTVWFGLA